MAANSASGPRSKWASGCRSAPEHPNHHAATWVPPVLIACAGPEGFLDPLPPDGLAVKTIPTALAAHLQGEVTRLASLFTITRKDGVTFRFTDHDRDLVHAGQTYRSRAGYERTAVAGTSGLETDSLEVTAVFDDEGITEHDLLAGAFDHAAVTLALVRWDDPARV